MAPHDPHPTEDELAERGRSLVAETVAGVRAPHALRERLEADRLRGGGRGRRLAVPAAGLAVLTAVLVAVLVLSGEQPGGPSFAEAAALTSKPAVARIERGRVGDRDATTTGYAGPRGRTIGYTVVEGPPLDPPGGRAVALAGTTYRVIRDGRRTLVTWVRSGRTCIVGAAAEVPERELLRLAAGF
jgi:hypothetical protein